VSSEKDDAWRRRGGLGEARLGKPSSPVQKFIRIRFIRTEISPRGAPTSGDALSIRFSCTICPHVTRRIGLGSLSSCSCMLQLVSLESVMGHVSRK
jgi:hypothetical protein